MALKKYCIALCLLFLFTQVVFADESLMGDREIDDGFELIQDNKDSFSEDIIGDNTSEISLLDKIYLSSDSETGTIESDDANNTLEFEKPKEDNSIILDGAPYSANIACHFSLSGKIDEIVYESKPTLDEVLRGLPEKLEVISASNTVMLPVRWYSNDDYDITPFFYYIFYPEISEEYHFEDGFSLPYVVVKVNQGGDEIEAASVTGKSVETQVYNFLINELNCNTATACGILANIENESSFNPTASVIDTNGLTSYGICQWNGGRFTSLQEYCGNSYTTVVGQLSFLKHELETSEQYAWSKMQGFPNTQQGAYDAGIAWARYFERCAERYRESRGVRARDKYWPEYQHNDIVSSSSFASIVDSITCDCEGKLYSYFGFPDGEDWCTYYVRYVLEQAYRRVGDDVVNHIPYDNFLSVTRDAMLWQSGDYGSYYSWTNWTYNDRSSEITSNISSYKPQVGDIVLVETDGTVSNGPDHMGIIAEVVSDSAFIVSEGNSGSGTTYTRPVRFYDYEYDSSIGKYRKSTNSSCIVHGICSIYNNGQVVIDADTTHPTIEDVYIHGIDANGYYIHCIVRDNVGLREVEFPTWTIENTSASGDDQDDIIWGSAGDVSGSSVELNYRVNYSDHNNELNCTYTTHIYCYDTSGNEGFYAISQYACNGAVMTSGYDRVIPNGDYIIVTACSGSKAEHYYLDIVGTALPANIGTNVALAGPFSNTEDPPAYDVWTLTYGSDGFYTIKQKGSEVSLDVANASVGSGANIQACSSNGTNAQKWAVSKNGRDGYRIQGKCSGLSLVVENQNAASGTNIHQYINSDIPGESWLFIPYKPSQPIENGRYMILSAVDNSKELDVPGNTGDIANGTKLQIWSDATQSQFNSFDVTKLSNGYYKITHHASGKVMEITGGGYDPTSPVTLFADNGSITQQWAIMNDGNGGYTLKVRSSGYAIDLANANTDNGSPVRQFYYNGTAAESWKFVKAEYTVSYNANGGTGVPGNQTKYYNNHLTLSSTKPSRTGYTFLSWNTKADGTGTTYQPGGQYTKNADVVLYAVWGYKATYDANGGTGAPAAVTFVDSSGFIIPDQIPVYEDYTFFGWRVVLDDGSTLDFMPGETYNIVGNRTLYAIWGNEVSYDANGGSGVPAPFIKEKNKKPVISEVVPVRDGYIFLGWAKNKNATVKDYLPGDEFTENLVVKLYAVWGYKVVFDANGGTDTPEAIIEAVGNNMILPSDIPAWKYEFFAWRAIVDGEKMDFEAGSEFNLQITTTLYAVWGNRVVYDANGGINPPEGFIKYINDMIVLSTEEPKRTGYAFLGWNHMKEADSPEYMPGDEFKSKDVKVLYAVWKKLQPDFIFPFALTTIEEEAFEGAAFTYVKLSENTTTIRSKAFANCQNLRNIYIPEATTTIAADAFSGVDKTMAIHGVDGSYAEFYANKYGFQFVTE